MTRKSLRRAAAGGALALAVAASGTAFAHGDDYGATIRLVEADPNAQPLFVDAGEAGPSVGDVAIFTGGLNRPDGTPAGDFHQTCTLVTFAGNRFTSGYECTGTIALKGGTITLQGSFSPAKPDQLNAISGGTGAFRTARGEVETQAVADNIVVRLAR
jgi:Allene oxide cyclase barrel like domain